MSRLVEAVVSGNPQRTGGMIWGGGELAAADRVFFDDLAAVDVNGEEPSPFLAELSAPEQVEFAHGIA